MQVSTQWEAADNTPSNYYEVEVAIFHDAKKDEPANHTLVIVWSKVILVGSLYINGETAHGSVYITSRDKAQPSAGFSPISLNRTTGEVILKIAFQWSFWNQIVFGIWDTIAAVFGAKHKDDRTITASLHEGRKAKKDFKEVIKMRVGQEAWVDTTHIMHATQRKRIDLNAVVRGSVHTYDGISSKTVSISPASVWAESSMEWPATCIWINRTIGLEVVAIPKEDA
ncbi:hypothetical protein RI367_002469 [Sorochytrium milnesiophthora]